MNEEEDHLSFELIHEVKNARKFGRVIRSDSDHHFICSVGKGNRQETLCRYLWFDPAFPYPLFQTTHNNTIRDIQVNDTRVLTAGMDKTLQLSHLETGNHIQTSVYNCMFHENFLTYLLLLIIVVFLFLRPVGLVAGEAVLGRLTSISFMVALGMAQCMFLIFAMRILLCK